MVSFQIDILIVDFNFHLDKVTGFHRYTVKVAVPHIFTFDKIVDKYKLINLQGQWNLHELPSYNHFNLS